MSKPVDIKTVQIYEHLKKKPSLENKILYPQQENQLSSIER